jgi:multidrug efflux pump subunit AcrA (membrane-fusion protein)
MWKENQEVVIPERNTLHPVSPFKNYISAVGIVEASSENISIGVPLNRIVSKVMVSVGENVKKGAPLIQLDDRDLKAELKTQQALYDIAAAKLQKLEQAPREEDIAVANADVINAEAELKQSQKQYEMVQNLQDPRALSQQEIDRRHFAYIQAEAKLTQSKANLNKVKSGTWKPDVSIAKFELQQARTNVERVNTEINRTTVLSPIDGKVLQIKIHEGELPPADTSRTPIMIVGNTDEKHLEVSINQYNASYFDPKAPSVAFLQGDARVQVPLEFVRLDPYLVNKQNITNDISEKVDTRVLQVVYKFVNNPYRIFVGQQMDVFIETNPNPTPNTISHEDEISNA